MSKAYRIITLRHRTTPPVAGCRWCGFPELGHSHSSPRQHFYELPTPAQRSARSTARGVWIMPGVASIARTLL